MNMRAARRIAMGVVVAALAGGCVVAPAYYYQPHAASGVVTMSDREPYGVPTMLVFQAPRCDWVQLRFRGYASDELRSSGFDIELLKLLPYGRDASDEVQDRLTVMRNQHFNVSFAGNVVTVTPAGKEPKQFALKLPYGGKPDFVFSYQDWSQDFDLDHRTPKYFDVDFPSLTIDGEKVDIPRIRFTTEFSIKPKGIAAISTEMDVRKARERPVADCPQPPPATP